MSVNIVRGKTGEDYTAEKLADRGYRIICRNYRCKGGEIDIIAEDKDELVFIEVKTRKFGSLTYGADAVDRAKKKRIILTSLRFTEEYGFEDRPMRYDISEVTVTTEEHPRVLDMQYFEDAFDSTGLNIFYF